MGDRLVLGLSDMLDDGDIEIVGVADAEGDTEAD